MRFTRTLRLKQAPKFDDIIYSARTTLNEAPQFFNRLKEDKKKTIYNKIIQFNNWYMKIIGIEEVKQAQDKVMLLQEELAKTREKYREAESKLNDVNLKRGEIHNDMGKVDKNVDFHRFIELRNQETEILKMVQPLGTLCQQYDQLERELFTNLTNAIRDAHEKERLQMEYSKYIGLVLSLVGSFCAFAFASLRKEDLKRYIDHTVNSNQSNLTAIQTALVENQDSLEQVKKLLENQRQLEPIYVVQEENQTNYWPYICTGAVVLFLLSSLR